MMADLWEYQFSDIGELTIEKLFVRQRVMIAKSTMNIQNWAQQDNYTPSLLSRFNANW